MTVRLAVALLAPVSGASFADAPAYGRALRAQAARFTTRNELLDILAAVPREVASN